MPPVFVANHVYALILYAAYLVWLLPEVISSFTDTAGKTLKVNDRASGAVLFASIWLAVFTGYLFAFLVRAAAFEWQRPGLFFAGIALMLSGVAFRWYSIRVLGPYFTRQVAVQPGQTVVQHGPYRWIRHPSYSGALLTLLGLGLVFTNWLSLLGVVAVALLGYSYRVRVEEQTLVQELGEPYRAYVRRTKRFIPFLY